MSILDSLTALEAQALDYVEQVQGTALDVLGRAVAAAERALPDGRLELPVPGGLPTLAEVVDTQFAFARTVLDGQHEFAKAAVTAIEPLLPAELRTEPVAEAARRAAA